MIINVAADFGNDLKTGEIAFELIGILDKIDAEEFVLDFKDVLFITMNFAQAYYIGKKDSSKIIKEINISNNIKEIMGLAEEQVNL